MKLILINSSGPVSQADLENVLALDAQIQRLQRLREQIMAGILTRVVAGGDVEPGPRSVDLDESFCQGSRRQRLVVR